MGWLVANWRFRNEFISVSQKVKKRSPHLNRTVMRCRGANLPIIILANMKANILQQIGKISTKIDGERNLRKIIRNTSHNVSHITVSGCYWTYLSRTTTPKSG